jgi:hydrogenase nickel incorporation protein HypA/HybF
MHEGHFTEQIVQGILAEAEKHPGARVRRIHVKVGDTYHLQTESVLTHFQSQIPGTRLEGAVLELEEVPLTVKCRACGREGGVEDHHLPSCPACHSLEVTILTGNTVTIESIELES